MKVEYSPGEGDVQEYSFVPDDVPQSQAEMIEKRYGKSWDDFLSDVRNGNAKARKVLLWHLLRQTHHTLRFEDTPDFKMGAVKVSFDVDELLAIRERVMKSALPAEDKDAVLTALDIDLAEAMDEPEPAAVAGPKGEPDAGLSSTTSPESGSDLTA